MTYDAMFADLQKEFHRLERENKRLKERQEKFDEAMRQLELVGRQNTRLKKELAAARENIANRTGNGVLKI